MATPNRPPSQNKYSEQNMGNTSFDEDFGVNAVEILGHNSTTSVLERIKSTNGVLQTSATVDTTGLALEAGHLATIDTSTAKIPAQGQALAAASLPIVLTAAQVTTLTPPAAITGFATSAKQDTLLTELQLKADLTETQPVSVTNLDVALSTRLKPADTLAAVTAVTNITNPVVIKDNSASSASATQVASSATNVTLKASNANRKMLIIVNDSTAILYVKLGATASATSYSYKLIAGDTLELPHPIYTEIVDGIWASANGFAYVTEY